MIHPIGKKTLDSQQEIEQVLTCNAGGECHWKAPGTQPTTVGIIAGI